jgi:hypothetical protein
MMRKLALGLTMTATTLMTVTAAATTQDSAIIRRHHVQCLIATVTLIGSEDPDLSRNAAMASMFFAGQLFGSHPTIDLTQAVKTELPKLDAEKLATLAEECGAEMAMRGQQLSAVEQVLAEEGGPLAP